MFQFISDQRFFRSSLAERFAISVDLDVLTLSRWAVNGHADNLDQINQRINGFLMGLARDAALMEM